MHLSAQAKQRWAFCWRWCRMCSKPQWTVVERSPKLKTWAGVKNKIFLTDQIRACCWFCVSESLWDDVVWKGKWTWCGGCGDGHDGAKKCLMCLWGTDSKVWDHPSVRLTDSESAVDVGFFLYCSISSHLLNFQVPFFLIFFLSVDNYHQGLYFHEGLA